MSKMRGVKSLDSKKSPTLPPLASPGHTYLSNRGYSIDVTGNETMASLLKDMCTVKPVVNPNAPGANMVREFPVYRESSKKLYIPRALGLRLLGPATRDRLAEGQEITFDNLAFNGSLRPEQVGIVDAFINAARDPVRQGGIISVGCGFGKTTMALYIASELRSKTLVVCHKEFLINQWRERIEQYLPRARVGLIKAKVLDVSGKDIVLASLQSIAMKEYEPGVFEQFGFVVIDEVHHTSAEVFSRALPKITARVMLGLSATLDRKDGLRKVFEWHLGTVVHAPVVRTDAELVVDVVRYPALELDEIHLFNGKLNVAAMMNALCASAARTKFIVDKLEGVLRADPGRRVLILSDRRAHLRELEELIQARGLGSTGYYVGGMKEADLAASSRCDIILGTNMMAAEGMDIPALNTLILASPVSSVEQQVGRVQRQKPCDRQYVPHVIDVWDDYSIFNNQGVRRQAFYKKKGFRVLYPTAGRQAPPPDQDEEASSPVASGFAFIDE